MNALLVAHLGGGSIALVAGAIAVAARKGGSLHTSARTWPFGSMQSAALVNERFAYVAGSRMRDGLDVYTDSPQQLTSSLERQFDKTAVVKGRSVGSR